MKKGWIIALISLGAVTGVYLYYRSQKKAKPLITIPAIAPLVTSTPTWLEALKGFFSPTPTVTEAVSVTPTYQVPIPSYQTPTSALKKPSPPLVAPTLTPEEKGLAEELGISEYTVRKFKQVM